MASMMELQNAEFKEAFDEFDTVKEAATNIVLNFLGMSSVCFAPLQESGFTATSKCSLPGIALFALVSSQQLFVNPLKLVFRGSITS